MIRVDVMNFSFERHYDAVQCQVLFDMLDEGQRMGRTAEFQEAVRRWLHPDLRKANILTDTPIQAGDMSWIRTKNYKCLVPGWTVVILERVLGARTIGDPTKIDEVLGAITFETGTPDTPVETVGTVVASKTSETSDAGVTAETSTTSKTSKILKSPPDPKY